MGRGLRANAWVGAVVALLWAGGAQAATVRLGFGADYAFEGTGIFSGLVQINTPLAEHLSVGGRFGGMFLTDEGPDPYGGTGVGIPVDLSLRAHFDQLYLEGLAGPWIVFSGYDPVRAHVAFAFGLETRVVSFGVELGYYHLNAIVGARLEFHL